ncbi:MAG TPA: hypothetical protein ENN80_07275, partial [Candidatus Hydrogenedentes bacterium]|nr:hypothetical protein [Candidatus Hydrogenedentota bacterium]
MISFAVRFVVFAPLCLVLWWLVLPVYARILGAVSSAILEYIANVPIESYDVSNTGLTNEKGILNTGTRLTFLLDDGTPRTMPGLGSLVTNVAPFVALVLATSTLTLLRRAKIIAIGLPVLFAAHVGFVLIAFLAGASEFSTALAQLFITLPFLLWIVLAYWES